MVLDNGIASRDYLYGRLLAIAESMERTALIASGEERPTNAERFFQRFADHPFSTWRTIELALNPYINILRSKRTGYFNNTEKLIMEVKSKFERDDYCNNERLSGEFLLGYDCQRMELSPWKKKDESEKSESETDNNDE